MSYETQGIRVRALELQSVPSAYGLDT